MSFVKRLIGQAGRLPTQRESEEAASLDKRGAELFLRGDAGVAGALA